MQMKLIARGLTVAAICVLSVPAFAQFSDRTLRVSNTVTEIHPVGSGMAAMRQCLLDRSGGRLKLQPYWGAALGDDGKGIAALRTGTLEMVTTSTSSFVGIVPQSGFFDLPYLIDNEKEADALLDGPIGNRINAELEKFDLINLGYWENSFRHATNSKRPITKWEDMQGLKMRVLPSNVYVDIFKTLGTTAQPMPFSEVIPALETKAIDGQDNSIINIETLKIYEVQKYLSLTKHTYTPLPLLYSRKLFLQLSGDEQKAVKDCAVVGRDAQRKASREVTDKALQSLKAKGMQVNEISPAEIARFREKTRPVWDRQAATIGADFIAAADAELAKIRKSK
jgi:TRAP-type transport system periplasmic protein